MLGRRKDMESVQQGAWRLVACPWASGTRGLAALPVGLCLLLQDSVLRPRALVMNSDVWFGSEAHKDLAHLAAHRTVGKYLHTSGALRAFRGGVQCRSFELR